jgi:DNA-binding transcriptional ArsR family regulator
MTDSERRWTFLTNHSHVLVCIAEDPDSRGRDIAERVGISERAVQAIIGDLVEGGYVTRERVGRRNHYTIDTEGRLRHPVEEGHTVGDLLAMLDDLPDAVPMARPTSGVARTWREQQRRPADAGRSPPSPQGTSTISRLRGSLPWKLMGTALLRPGSIASMPCTWTWGSVLLPELPH